MLKRLISILLCLILCTSAGAEGLSLSGTLTLGETSLTDTLLIGTAENGMPYASLGGMTVTGDEYRGMLVAKDGEWRQLSLLGYALGCANQSSDALLPEDLQQSLWADLGTLIERMGAANSSFIADPAVMGLVVKLGGLLSEGTLTVTGEDLNGLINAALSAYGAELLGASLNEAGDLILPRELPPLFAGLKLERLYSMLWNALWNSCGGMVPIYRMMDFTLTLTGGLTSGCLTLMGANLSLTVSYEAEMKSLGYRFSVVGRLGDTAISAEGTLGASSLNMKASVGAWQANMLLVLGGSPALTLTVADSRSGSLLCSVSAAWLGNGVSLTADIGGVTLTATALNGSASFTVNAQLRRSTDSPLAPPAARLDMTLTSSMLILNCATPEGNLSLTGTVSSRSADVQLTRYSYADGSAFSFNAYAVQKKDQLNLSGTITDSGASPVSFSAKLYTQEKWGVELVVGEGGLSTTFTAMLEQPSADSWQLVMQQTLSGTAGGTRGIVLTTARHTHGWQWDLTADDSEDDYAPFRATLTLTQTEQGWTGQLQWDGFSGTASLVMEDEHTARLALSMIAGDVSLVDGSLTAVYAEEENALKLLGGFALYGNETVSLDAMVKPCAIQAPVLPEQIPQLELKDLPSWLMGM